MHNIIFSLSVIFYLIVLVVLPTNAQNTPVSIYNIAGIKVPRLNEEETAVIFPQSADRAWYDQFEKGLDLMAKGDKAGARLIFNTLGNNNLVSSAEKNLVIRHLDARLGSLPNRPDINSFDQKAGMIDLLGVSGQPDLILAKHYVKNFLLPLKRAELNQSDGKFEDALKDLFSVYHDKIFTGTSSVAMEKLLNQSLGKPKETELLHIEDAKINQFGTLSEDSKSLIKKQAAQIWLEWGDDLFSTTKSNNAVALERYRQVLRIYPEVWQRYVSTYTSGQVSKSPSLVTQVDPEVVELVLTAILRANNAVRGTDFTGFDDLSTPVWTYSFLRQTTIGFLENAKGLEQRLFALTEKKIQDAEKNLILLQSIEMAQLNIRGAENKITIANQVLENSRANSELSALRFHNKIDQANQGAQSLDFMKAKHKEINEAENGWKRWLAKVGASVLAAGAAVVSGIATGGATLAIIGGAVAAGGAPLVSEAIDNSIRNDVREAEQAIQQRQAQDNIDQNIRESTELLKAFMISAGEIKRDSLSRLDAEINLDLSTTNLTHQIQQYELLQNSPLNDAILTAMIADANRLIDQYIIFAVYLAKMTQKAYQVEELDDTNVIKNFKDYRNGGASNWLIADRILLDLNIIEYKRITQKRQKENNATYYVSLKNKNPWEMEQLRQDGKIHFDITQFELDVKFPGAYRHYIKDIDVTVIALTDPSGVKGQLTKEGLSWVKVPNTFTGTYTVSDWFQYVPSDYSLAVRKDDPETLLLPKQKTANQDPDNIGLRGIFEERGVCGSYTLELPKYSNDFDYNTIADVIITINFSCYYDPVLKGMIETELCQMENAGSFQNQRELSHPISIAQPDEWYYFKNTDTSDISSRKERIIPVFIHADRVPKNQSDIMLQGLTIAFSKEGKFVPVKCSVTSANMNIGKILTTKDGALNPKINLDSLTWYSNFKYITNNSETVYIQRSEAGSFSKTNAVLVNPLKNYEVWLLRITAKDNPELNLSSNPDLFDQSKIDSISDITLGFEYSFSYKFCESYPKVTAETSIDGKANATDRNGITTEVPFLYVRKSDQQYEKKHESSGANFHWTTNTNDKSFEMTAVLDPNADIFPIKDFVSIKGNVEAIDLVFDIKNDSSIFYFPLTPSELRVIARKINLNGKYIRKLTVQADTIAQLGVDRWVTVKTIYDDRPDGAFHLMFRYVNLPNLQNRATVDIFTVNPKSGDPEKIFRLPIPFRRSSQGQQSNFSMTMRDTDSPKPNLILKKLTIRDFSKR